eukprot:TRINITY_DN2482_c0_g1_i6.p1 TRINITY_DN2482_c0_g1~~TRINITY_DN2482_c0_g1_i6.p1  ORF type:complete len:281 (+),score=75.00 TRINITY_DN2482_c0_g1_i6:325-1167(+)
MSAPNTPRANSDLEEIELSDMQSPREVLSSEPAPPRVDLEEIELSDTASPRVFDDEPMTPRSFGGESAFSSSVVMSTRVFNGGLESPQGTAVMRTRSIIGQQMEARKESLNRSMDLLREMVNQGASPPSRFELFLSVAQTLLFLIHLVGRVSLGLPFAVSHEAHINDPEYTISFITTTLPNNPSTLPQSVMAWTPMLSDTRLSFTLFFWIFFGFLTIGSWVYLTLRQIMRLCGSMILGLESAENQQHHKDLEVQAMHSRRVSITGLPSISAQNQDDEMKM